MQANHRLRLVIAGEIGDWREAKNTELALHYLFGEKRVTKEMFSLDDADLEMAKEEVIAVSFRIIENVSLQYCPVGYLEYQRRPP